MKTTLKRSSRSWPVVVLCQIYAAGVLSFFALRALLPYWPPMLALINSIAPFLFSPLVLALPFALLSRSRAALIGSLAVLALFAVLFGNCFLPHIHPAIASADGTLIAMTFNLGAGRAQPESLAAAIESERADLVAVQEFSPAEIELFRKRLSTQYPYMILDLDKSTSGLLSRHPILTHEWFRAAGQGRPTLDATLDVNGSRLRVLAVHPYPPGLDWYKDTPIPIGLNGEENEQEMADIAQRAADLKEPVLVIGDFNMSDQTRAYTKLSGTLNDTYREAGWGLGLTFPYGLQVGRFPVPGPLVRIDYIFHSNGLRAEQARVTCRGGSDHCYLVARLTRTL